MNECITCNALIKEGEIYCDNCHDKMAQQAPIMYMQAMMRGDILTANRIKADYPSLEISSMVMSDENGTYRVCSKCGYKNRGEFQFKGTYTCNKCGNKI